jgi:hypothetical protein
MKTKEFFLRIPYLCDAKNPDRWARLIELQYEDELRNDKSVFSRNMDDIKNPSNRLETAFAFDGNVRRMEHCKKLVELIMLNHYRKEHGETEWDNRINTLINEITPMESQNIDITNTMSIDQALLAWWDN